MVAASSTEQILRCPRLKSCRWLYLAGALAYQFTNWPGLPRVGGREGIKIDNAYENSNSHHLAQRLSSRGCALPRALLCRSISHQHLWQRSARQGELSGAEAVRPVLLTVTVYKILTRLLSLLYYWWMKFWHSLPPGVSFTTRSFEIPRSWAPLMHPSTSRKIWTGFKKKDCKRPTLILTVNEYI